MGEERASVKPQKRENQLEEYRSLSDMSNVLGKVKDVQDDWDKVSWTYDNAGTHEVPAVSTTTYSYTNQDI